MNAAVHPEIAGLFCNDARDASSKDMFYHFPPFCMADHNQHRGQQQGSQSQGQESGGMNRTQGRETQPERDANRNTGRENRNERDGTNM